MSIFDAGILTEKYADEIKKQTDSYGYYCQNENIKRGEQLNGSCPPFCIVTSLSRLIFGDKDSAEETAATDKKYLFIRCEGNSYESDELSTYLMRDVKQDIIYWDSDRMLEGKRHVPYFKPDWSPDTLLACNYIGDSYMIRTELAMQVIDQMRAEWQDSELNSINDSENSALESYEKKGENELRYAFLLRATELTDSIVHIPIVAEHISDDTVDEDEIYSEFVWKNQSQKYINIRNEALKRRELQISYEKVFERKDNNVINNNVINNIVIKPNNEQMNLSIVIPSKDHCDILFNCLNSIKKYYNSTGDKSLEIIIVDNGSNDENRLKIEQYLGEYSESVSTSYIYESMDFNYSKMCNIGADAAKGEYILFLNDDIELVDDNTLERLYAYATLPHIGAVGAKLYYPNGNIIQHTGVVASLDCGPTHKLATHSDDKPYYYGINVFNRNVLAVTGACLMVEREKYFKVGGFSDKMGVSYNDVDLCVKLHENGYFNVVLNECILFHHESLSRGMDHIDDAKYLRLKEERQLLYDVHPWLLPEGDPFYSHNLIKDSLDYSVNVVPDYSIRGSRSELIGDASLKKKLLSLVAADRNKAAVNKKGEKNRTGHKRIHYNVESTGFERGIMKNETDYYSIEGWAVLGKRDNAMYDTYVALIKEDGTCLIFTAFKKNREDVAVVFASEKNICLSGFICKIPAEYIEKDATYRLAIILKSRLSGLKYEILGDYYEPARGYYTEEV